MKKLISLLLALCLALGVCACSPEKTGDGSSEPPASSAQEDASSTAEAALPDKDPSGASITVPEEINSIVVLAPSIAETIIALGYGDKIVAYDTQSAGLEGIPADKPTFDLMQPDMEQLTALKPDVLFVSNMTLYDESSPYEQLIDLGVCVICVPSSDSIADIESDIAFLASVFGEKEKGDELIGDMQAEIERIQKIAQTIPEKKKVYFEIAAAPDLYSFGSGVFLNELVEIIGAENILADQQGWLPVEAETVVAANPDVILTNVNYIEDPEQEIMSRSGWEAVEAVKEKNVYYIDNMASSLPNQNVIKALDQMAKAVYPEYYGE